MASILSRPQCVNNTPNKCLIADPGRLCSDGIYLPVVCHTDHHTDIIIVGSDHMVAEIHKTMSGTYLNYEIQTSKTLRTQLHPSAKLKE